MRAAQVFAHAILIGYTNFKLCVKFKMYHFSLNNGAVGYPKPMGENWMGERGMNTQSLKQMFSDNIG
ncbi:hypothetical protein A9Q02_19600 [Candidatus Chloroploca asiatica]|uniref:Uncharacterized protein n=1 Tax=Candidatus Chloroploca asiatica TaxID=1506545 RepID=A0A2H3KH30_9CHLR|nr:hypothetical protein A9Q02_19600 [Candidatus Chloroploca asiatica]